MFITIVMIGILAGNVKVQFLDRLQNQRYW